MDNAARIMAYSRVSLALDRLDDRDVTAMLRAADPLGEGIGGPTYRVVIADVPVFVKRVRLTDVERRNPMSTANLFDLPVHYQYGVGSAGFSAWRELAAHQATTGSVLSGECESFPLLYGWRILPREPGTRGDPEEVQQMIDYWEGDRSIGRRLWALHEAPETIALFLEFVPTAVHEWLRANPAGIERVEADLLGAVDVMNRNGVLHFDGHFNNVMADDDRLYVGDFGLATGPRFDLSAAERSFADQHRHYDMALSSLMLAATAAHMRGADDSIPYLRNTERGRHVGNRATDDAADRVRDRHAAAAIVMHDFFEGLRTSKRTPYPADALADALGRVRGRMP